MFVFIIPLKSKKVAKDWYKTCLLFERTLRSVCNQTSTCFSVLVVCHEKPDVNFTHEQVQYIQVDFPPPHREKDSDRKWYFKCEVDKNRKILMGLCLSKSLMPNYVMPVDADDCINRRLVEYTEKNPNCNGWVVTKGYLYNERDNILTLKYRKFNLVCGTCHIISYDLIDLPADPQYNRGYGYYREHVIFMKHDLLENAMDMQGTPLMPLPFSGAVYIVQNNENIYFRFDRGIYGHWVENLAGYSFMTYRIRKDFCLYPINFIEKLRAKLLT